jgi:hypothetical protein
MLQPKPAFKFTNNQFCKELNGLAKSTASSKQELLTKYAAVIKKEKEKLEKMKKDLAKTSESSSQQQ